MRLRVVHIIGLADIGGGRTIGLTMIAPGAEHFETHAILGRKGDLPELLRKSGVTVHTTGLDEATSSLLSIPSIARILRQIKPHLVINHGQPAGMVGALACRLAGIRSILYVTIFPSFYTDWDLFRVIRNHLVERISCRAATMVGCSSRAARYQYLLRRLVSVERSIYYPLGVDVSRIRPWEDKRLLRRELGLPQDKPLVVSVGRLADQKCVDWLVKAWAKVEAVDTNAELVIVGDGPERPALERLATDLGLKRCRFLGAHPSGATFFSAADIGVVTTMYEIPGLTVLEAMAAGCPVVVTAVDGVSESVTDSEGGGKLVPPADTDALAAGILELLRDEPARRAMGQRGRVYMENSRSLAETQTFQCQLIQQLAEKSVPGVGQS